ncbi:NEW3 domain-containing protein [Streptomyces sp. ARC32]
MDGLSLAKLLTTGTEGPRHEHLYWYRNDPWSTPRAAREDGGRILTLAEAAREGHWKAVRFAPARDRTVPDDRWHVELYDLDTDFGERTDVAAAHPDITAGLVAVMREAWVEEYQRVPFGVRLTGPGLVEPGCAHEVTATVANGSAEPWPGTVLRLTGPRGWRLRRTSGPVRADLAPGEVLRQTWRVTVPADATAEARLTAESRSARAGRTIRFTAEHRFTPSPGARTGAGGPLRT